MTDQQPAPVTVGANKAVVGTAAVAGSQSLSYAIVVVALWAFHSTPPNEVALALQTLVSAALGLPSVFFSVYYARNHANG